MLTPLLRLVEYESVDGARVARMERIGSGWVVRLSGTVGGGEWRERQEHHDVAKARYAARMWTRDGARPGHRTRNGR